MKSWDDLITADNWPVRFLIGLTLFIIVLIGFFVWLVFAAILWVNSRLQWK